MTEKPSGVASAEADRRAFLTTCGKFAAVTPPAMTLLLSTSLTSPAIAYSGGKGHHEDNGHHYGQLKQVGRDD